MKAMTTEKKKGFTLPEVAISLLIFALAMTVLVGIYAGFASLTWSNRNLTQALNDARVVMEQIRDTSAGGGLAAVTGTDWAAWVASSAGGNLTDPLTRTNPSPLPAEAIQVQYTSVWGDPEQPGADPLPVIVRVDWQERGRNRSAMVNTLVTRR